MNRMLHFQAAKLPQYEKPISSDESSYISRIDGLRYRSFGLYFWGIALTNGSPNEQLWLVMPWRYIYHVFFEHGTYASK